MPPNPNPAKVINLSLGGFGACDQSIQEAIDDALAQGAVVVVAAGNEYARRRGLHARQLQRRDHGRRPRRTGGLASYSNFGRRIDLTAPGGDLPRTGLMVSLGQRRRDGARGARLRAGRGHELRRPAGRRAPRR